jgi:glycosyltransferase involved in cell wall biosynthesis
VPVSKSLLIENAIDTEQFRRTQSPALAKEAIGWPASRFLVGAVGRLSTEKGFDHLIRAVNTLMKRGVDLGLVIAGDGPEREALKALIDDFGLVDRIRLLGFQRELRPLYEAMDLFVLSSIREGLPNALLEAMSLEVPVIGTRVAGVPRLIDNGQNGWLVPPGDAAALANSIQFAMSDDQMRSQFTASGRRTIETKYSFAVRMQKVAAVYDQLLATCNGSA